ncbi:MAG: hypothetical protein JO228_07435 [Xanthobacteraceae bacterium]|nr:hypothetical protein [Xanthobacteraceae bacterium]
MQLTKFDALAAIIAAATGLAMAEDRSRTEIATSPATPTIEATSAGTCAQAEYRGRALRVSVILTGGMPDADWRGQTKPVACIDAAPVKPAPLYRTYVPDLVP